jgi:hypothetical protein
MYAACVLIYVRIMSNHSSNDNTDSYCFCCFCSLLSLKLYHYQLCLSPMGLSLYQIREAVRACSYCQHMYSEHLCRILFAFGLIRSSYAWRARFTTVVVELTTQFSSASVRACSLAVRAHRIYVMTIVDRRPRNNILVLPLLCLAEVITRPK